MIGAKIVNDAGTATNSCYILYTVTVSTNTCFIGEHVSTQTNVSTLNSGNQTHLSKNKILLIDLANCFKNF